VPGLHATLRVDCNGFAEFLMSKPAGLARLPPEAFEMDANPAEAEDSLKLALVL
jgi:hypothetical protein